VTMQPVCQLQKSLFFNHMERPVRSSCAAMGNYPAQKLRSPFPLRMPSVEAACDYN
jgi:hypothetical protein